MPGAHLNNLRKPSVIIWKVVKHFTTTSTPHIWCRAWVPIYYYHCKAVTLHPDLVFQLQLLQKNYAWKRWVIDRQVKNKTERNKCHDIRFTKWEQELINDVNVQNEAIVISNCFLFIMDLVEKCMHSTTNGWTRRNCEIVMNSPRSRSMQRSGKRN